ncbi:MAG TPA: hypothetical protein VFV39_11000, partial [Limnobacter sp.]|nr:hypothetical protein [Limnobacter sp.]
FAPTLGQDIWNNYNHHATLDQKFNFKQFAVDTAKNQTGNLAGMVGGAALAKATAIIVFATTGFAIAGAPLVLIALGSGVLIGAAYNTEIQKSVEQKAKILFGLN